MSRNAIEESTLVFAETYALLFDNKHSKIEQAEDKKIYEAINRIGQKIFYLDYENIPPYPDGNGHTGRLMINYILLSANQVPIVNLIAYSENSKKLKSSKACIYWLA